MSQNPNLFPPQPAGPGPAAPVPPPLGTPAYATPARVAPQVPTSAQVRAMPVPHPVPETYPHILRTVTWERDWWRPLVGILILLFWFFIGGGLVTMPFLVVGFIVQSQLNGTSFMDEFNRLGTMTEGDLSPATLMWLNLTLASTTLCVFALMFLLHRLKPRWSTSVFPGLRWKYFFACLGLSVIALGAQLGLSELIPSADATTGAANAFTGETLAYAVIVLCTTPFQAIGEEYAFRGYLLFATGSLGGWVLEKWKIGPDRARQIGSGFAIVVTALLFAIAHGSQNFPLFFDRFAFGLISAILVVVTGGLEAGIALHVLNNLTAFGLALAFDDIGKSLTVSEVPWSAIPLTITQNGLYLVLAWLVARKMGLSRYTRGLAPTPSVPAAATG